MERRTFLSTVTGIAASTAFPRFAIGLPGQVREQQTEHAKAARITNHPELNAFVKEPAREGWRYGELLSP